jgi:hypothetical protein
MISIVQYIFYGSPNIVYFVESDQTTVHIGVCHAHKDCPNKPHPGPCGCPDCNKPHPPHFQNSYCENLSAATSEVNEEDVADEDRTTGENGTNGAGQTGSSRFTWVWVAAAAAACAAVGAAVMRKRVRI